MAAKSKILLYISAILAILAISSGDLSDEDLSTKDGHGKYINDDALDVEEEDQAGQTEAQ